MVTLAHYSGNHGVFVVPAVLGILARRGAERRGRIRRQRVETASETSGAG